MNRILLPFKFFGTFGSSASTTTATTSDNLPYPPPTTLPNFPPIPRYGPATLLNRIKWRLLRILSNILSTIGILILGICMLLALLPPYKTKPPRPFRDEENRRAQARREEEEAWKKRSSAGTPDTESEAEKYDGFIPTEGGPDKYVVDVGYYARRVGLDSETVKVQTEDGHILSLWHVFDPREYTPLPAEECSPLSTSRVRSPPAGKGNMKPKYPVLMIHGLLQSAGVYCTTDEHSLAFWLCKQGYDVWLGNNRSGFVPEHASFSTSDPNMWTWNIRHMGQLDLPAMTTRILQITGFEKLALIAHSQGTTQTLISLSISQRPSLGSSLSVFCALAPAAYSGPLLSQQPFKTISRFPIPFFRLLFGPTLFLPIITKLGRLHGRLPEGLVGKPSYFVYNWLFGWGDERWDRGLRDRCFMFAPTCISAEAMKWWFSKEGFLGEGCILSRRGEWEREDEMDREREADFSTLEMGRGMLDEESYKREKKWYDERSPPMAFWIAGKDTIVDGEKLVRRFRNGREPDARLIHVNVLKEYSHLDVVWSYDVIDRIGKEILEVVWRTCEERGRARCPRGCEGVDVWVDDRVGEGREKIGEEGEGVSIL